MVLPLLCVVMALIRRQVGQPAGYLEVSVTWAFKEKTRKTTPRVKGFLRGALGHLSATAAFLERTHPVIRRKRKTRNE